VFGSVLKALYRVNFIEDHLWGEAPLDDGASPRKEDLPQLWESKIPDLLRFDHDVEIIADPVVDANEFA
jgi:hypothetical protein